MSKNKKKSNQIKDKIKIITQNSKDYGRENTENEEELDSEINSRYMQQELDHNEDKHKLSLCYFKIIILFIFGYITLILLLFFCIGMQWLKYNSSDIGVFLGTTSIHIIGLGYVVVHWLYPNVKTPNAS